MDKMFLKTFAVWTELICKTKEGDLSFKITTYNVEKALKSKKMSKVGFKRGMEQSYCLEKPFRQAYYKPARVSNPNIYPYFDAHKENRKF